MYHYHDSTPEPSHWLEQVYATNNALDDGFNVRSWPYGQLHTGLRSPLGERFATSQQSSFHAQSVASAWDNALGTRQLESPLGTLTSSRTSRITSSAAAACPSVPTTVEAPPYRLHSHQPHWQSPTQHRTHTISAQQPGHAASDSSLPSQSQGDAAEMSVRCAWLVLLYTLSPSSYGTI